MRYLPQLDPSLVEEATRHTHATWALGKSPQEHAAHTFAQLENAGPEVLRYVGLASDDGRLLASIKRYGLLLRAPSGGLVRAAGIGAVFTPEAGRGKGAASALLRAVLAEARDLGYGAAYLYSDIEPAFYARLGFVELPALDHGARTSDLPSHSPLAARPAQAGDVERMIGWYEASWSAGWLRPARTPALWRYFAWRNRLAQWVLSEGGEEVGYLVAGPHDPQRDLPDVTDRSLLWVDEWGAPGVAGERIWATVRALAERHEAASVGSWLRAGAVPPGFTSAPRREAVPMIAPLGEAGGLSEVVAARAYLGALEHF